MGRASLVNGKFAVRVWPPADRGHSLAAARCRRCLPPHRRQGRCGGKNRVTASPPHIKTRVQRHGHDVKDAWVGFGEGGPEPCQSVVIILALRFSEHNWEHRSLEERDAQQDGARARGGREHFGLGIGICSH